MMRWRYSLLGRIAALVIVLVVVLFYVARRISGG
jgi:hypothetical protein